MKFIVDCSKVENYEDFIEACNIGFIRSVGGEWNGNLDAFNDYLSWPEPNPYELIIKNAQRCKSKLHYPYKSTNQMLWEVIEEMFGENGEWVNVKYQ